MTLTKNKLYGKIQKIHSAMKHNKPNSEQYRTNQLP